MQFTNNKAIVLWTGGKDCNLALHEAKLAGYEIVRLVTFLIGGELRAHPQQIMEQQAASLRIPYEVITIGEPFKESYESVISELKNKYDISTIVTGDIAEVLGNTNWITERCKPSGTHVFLPLWHLERKQILQRLVDLKFKVIFSCVKEPWFTIEWLGKELNGQTIKELEILHEKNGVDLCGENGEYHSLVLNGPDYANEIIIKNYTKQNDNGTFFINV